MLDWSIIARCSQDRDIVTPGFTRSELSSLPKIAGVSIWNMIMDFVRSVIR